MLTQSKPQAEAAQFLNQAASGYVVSSALNAAARLRIADLLAAGPLSASELARKTQSNEDALRRALRLLSSTGIFEELADDKFTNTEASQGLRSDVPNSQLDMISFICDPFHFKVYADMVPTIRDGKSGIFHVFGKEAFEAFESDASEQKLFDDAMTNLSKRAVPAVLDAYDFSGIGTLVDVAGGHGLLLTSILERYPQLNGILFDLQHVVPGATARIKQLKLENRCTTESGDFFKSVPAGDAYIMKHIIHDWDDEKSITILKNCRKALRGQKGKVLLVEFLLGGPNEPDPSKFMDIEMLMMPGGRERNEEGYARLFDQSGFKLARVIKTKSPLCIFEAEAV